MVLRGSSMLQATCRELGRSGSDDGEVLTQKMEKSSFKILLFLFFCERHVFRNLTSYL